MKVGIIGLGFVGLSLAVVLGSKGVSTIGIEIDKKKYLKIKDGIIPFYEPKLGKTLHAALKKNFTISTDISLVNQCDLIFITVGTPQRLDGSIDLSIIKSTVKNLGKVISKTKKKPTIIIKSTVIPQTTTSILSPILENISGKKIGKDFDVITNPEFLREGKAIDDTTHPHVIVIGGNKTIFLKRLEKFYSRFFPSVPKIITNHQTSEMIKYANNSFLATKISFINQIASICEKIPGTNVDDVAKAIGLDPRIGNLFLNAGPGYGGSCLPKDVKAIINFSHKSGVNPTLLNAVEKTNANQLKNIILTIKRILGSIKGKNITVLGVAFKPNTDDVRDSIAIELIKILLTKGAKIKIHDPKALENAKKIFSNKIEYMKHVDNALKNSECAIIMTQWKQFSMINQKQFKLMKQKNIIDCRRIFHGKKFDVNYFAIGLGR